MFSGSKERDQWHEMSQMNFEEIDIIVSVWNSQYTKEMNASTGGVPQV